MDLQMPVMDGFASASAIRCLEKFDDVPILAMTAHVFPEEQKRCLAVGMDGFLPKPIDLELWQAVLAHWLPISDAWPGRDHAMLEIDGVDTRSGLRRVTDNFELYSSLLRDFGSRIPQLSEQFATGAERADLSGLRTLAHSLRGEAGNLGAYQLAEQAADLERLARSQDIQGARVLVERLQASLSRLVKELQQNLPELLLSSSEDLDHNIAGPMLERLEIQLRQCEGGAVDTLHELWPHLGPLTTHGSAERLYRCVQEFDFCQAAQELQELKSQLGLNFTAPGQVG